ncbi:MAG: ABC-2 family transporter protein [Acholeplasmataceae bacterium]|jgi:ABC-2 type transport system permease protein|nr:ABC-2 family transporter protein [Acholeplasmataceae bacterium]
MRPNKFKKYLAFSKAGILDGFAYKFSALGWLLGDIISLLILFFLWQAVYKNSPNESINGMTFHEMIAYLIFARVATSLAFSSISFWIIGDDIYEGNIAISLIRPINYRYRLLSSSFGVFLSTAILMFIPLWTLSMILLNRVIGIPIPEIGTHLLFILSILLSFVIADSLNFLIGQMAIFTNALFGLMIIKNVTFAFLSGSLLPSSYFPDWLSNILKFLPFQSMIEKPIMIFLDRLSPREIISSFLVQILWIILLGLLCNFSFNRLKKRVVSVGG